MSVFRRREREELGRERSSVGRQKTEPSKTERGGTDAQEEQIMDEIGATLRCFLSMQSTGRGALSAIASSNKIKSDEMCLVYKLVSPSKS